MKFSTKQITTYIISFVIMLMCFAIFVLFFNDSQKETVTYIVDEANTCTWEQDVIIASTEVFGELKTIEVEANKEASYLLRASTNGECTAKLDSDIGNYDTQLNNQYRQQQL